MYIYDISSQRVNESLSRHFPRYSGGARAVDGVGSVQWMGEPIVVRRSNDGIFSALCEVYVCRSARVARIIMPPQILVNSQTWQSGLALGFVIFRFRS